MKKILLFLTLLFTSNSLFASYPTSYDIKGKGVGTQGTYLVEIVVESTKADVTLSVLSQIKASAIHGVLFSGFTIDSPHRLVKPLISDSGVEIANRNFFVDFFDERGEFERYADIASTKYSIVKLGRKLYKITAVVSVKKDMLRTAMEGHGIIKKLGAGF